MNGDASNLDMHRGTKLSSAISKLFESDLVKTLGDDLTTDELQFGFKSAFSLTYVQNVCLYM